MSVVQNLYQIFKLPASLIADNNCVVNHYSFLQGKTDGNIVSIGDNLVFQQVRYLHNDYRSHTEVYEEIAKMRSKMHEYVNAGEYKKAHILQQCIDSKLFVKDIVNIYVDKKKSDFHKFRTKGFTFNNNHYTYLCSGSGQIRRNTATFVNSEIYPQLFKILSCGLDEKTKTMSLGKYSAYFALSFSSILWVTTPRCCVVKDFFRTLKDQRVDFITKDKEGNSCIEERIMDLELNCADGQGLIDPNFAENVWSKDLNLGFTPCSFVVRSCFVKGNLVPFDFKEYAHLHGITKIYDAWGVPYDIDSIDVILAESQFKTHKYYNSWQDYLSYSTKNNIHWGVARYNKNFDPEYVLSNYQYIQSLDLSKEDIKELIAPTTDWIRKICSGDPLYSLLYLFGVKDENADFQAIYSAAQTNPTKAVIKNIDFLEDTYVQKKIYKNITETINHSKIGKVWIRGNYQFCIADPLAQCQSALGLDPVGCVGKDEVYSAWWNERIGAGHVVDICRSPMIDTHEHNPSTLMTSDDAEYWFRYIPSGIIFSTYDSATARMEDSDFDGDIVLTTDNKYFIKGSHKDHNIITYEKGNYTPSVISIANVTKAVSKGFGTAVGSFSNTATCLYAMAAMFDNPKHKEQHDVLMTRIKLLREIVGQEIDRIKGADKPSLPDSWKKYQRVLPTDSEEEKKRKYKANSLIVSKKPYFFRYLYPELNQRYKQFEASYNAVSCDMFGIKFKKLLKKENKTKDELNLIRKYKKFSPLITSNCVMNILCREMESVDFDIQFMKDEKGNKQQVKSCLPTFEEKYADTFSQEKLATIKKLYQRYNSRVQVKIMAGVLDNIPGVTDLDEYHEINSSILDSIIVDIQHDMMDANIPGDEFLFYCNRLSKQYRSFNWGFAWEILEDQIISLIPFGVSYAPVRVENFEEAQNDAQNDAQNLEFGYTDADRPHEYLGAYYYLKDVSREAPALINNDIELGSIDEFDEEIRDIDAKQEKEQEQNQQEEEVESNE